MGLSNTGECSFFGCKGWITSSRPCSAVMQKKVSMNYISYHFTTTDLTQREPGTDRSKFTQKLTEDVRFYKNCSRCPSARTGRAARAERGRRVGASSPKVCVFFDFSFQMGGKGEFRLTVGSFSRVACFIRTACAIPRRTGFRKVIRAHIIIHAHVHIHVHTLYLYM